MRILVSIALAAVAMPVAAQAPDGGAIFKQRCQMCHAAEPGTPPGIGPNLAGVVDRKAASTGYAYSTALKASGLTWDKATLDRFLSGPSRAVPGTRMPVAVSAPKDRGALIAYLATLKK